MRKTLQARVAANAAELARHGTPRKSFYLTGRVGDQTIALHASGSRVVLTREDGTREEVDLSHLGQRAEPGVDTTLPEPVAICGPASGLVGAEVEPHEQETPAPGSSPLDGALEILASGLERDDAKGAVSPSAGESASGDEDDDAEGAAGVLVRT